jgi:hypothetical protein
MKQKLEASSSGRPARAFGDGEHKSQRKEESCDGKCSTSGVGYDSFDDYLGLAPSFLSP